MYCKSPWIITPTSKMYCKSQYIITFFCWVEIEIGIEIEIGLFWPLMWVSQNFEKSQKNRQNFTNFRAPLFPFKKRRFFLNYVFFRIPTRFLLLPPVELLMGVSKIVIFCLILCHWIFAPFLWVQVLDLSKFYEKWTILITNGQQIRHLKNLVLGVKKK